MRFEYFLSLGEYFLSLGVLLAPTTTILPNPICSIAGIGPR